MQLSALQQEFLDDHRVLISGLRDIITAIETDELERAVETAKRLDREAGAHMAFEEEVFYPQLARTYGDEFVERMVAEHEAGHRAIKSLIARQDAPRLAAEERSEILDDLGVALKHVMSCGTMLSELGTGKADVDEGALDHLRTLRDRAEPWSRRSYGKD